MPIRDLVDAIRLSIDDTLSMLYAMSKDPKDRCQVAMLYRKVVTPAGINWVNEGVAQVRACQGHSIPWIFLDRLGMSVSAERVKDLPCLCHGTSRGALANILKDSLKPGSHLDPATLRSSGRHPPRRGEAKGTGRGKYERNVVSERQVLMMLPYPYFDK